MFAKEERFFNFLFVKGNQSDAREVILYTKTKTMVGESRKEEILDDPPSREKMMSAAKKK